MSKIQINDVKLDGAELFNDSETFLNELKESEMEQIFGGFRAELVDVDKELRIHLDDIKVDDRIAVTTVYIPKEPICHYPIKPVYWHPKPIHGEKPIYPIQPIHFCPVIL